MRIDVVKPFLKQSALYLSLVFSGLACADTVTYDAITDFPIIDSGEVPYYRDQARQALAINAANVNYRDRFAKAEVIFDGQPGIYQLTLVGLAELDGEADYRISINGEVVGLASNPEVVEDFSVVRHEFPDIELPVGAIIAVESLANSNGKIPENGEFAFARGRWTMLELSDSPSELERPDLSVTVTGPDSQPMVGEPFELQVSVANASDHAVATGASVHLQLTSSALTLADDSVCSGSSTVIDCPLPEIGSGESADVSLMLQAGSALSDVPLMVSVTSDQTDHDETDNARVILISTATVDMQTGNSSESAGQGAGNSGSSEESQGESSSVNEQSVQSMGSGGGAWSILALLAGAILLLQRMGHRE